jgi:predicted transcriptional regulator
MIMDVVWDRGEVTVRQVQDALKPERELAYTSVLTMMQVLERKGFVGAHRVGRANVYAASVTRDRFGVRSAMDVVNSFFAGSVPAMISQFVETEHLNSKDLDKLRAIMSEALAKKTPDDSPPQAPSE